MQFIKDLMGNTDKSMKRFIMFVAFICLILIAIIAAFFMKVDTFVLTETYKALLTIIGFCISGNVIEKFK